MADEIKNGMLDWDSEIEDDGKGGAKYIVLEEGDFIFEVTAFCREQWKGSEKIPAGTKVAAYELAIDTKDGEATCKCDIPLHTSMEWKISGFFRSVGMKKHGEKVKPDWMGAIGKKGIAHFKPRNWSDGSGNQSNDIAYFIDYDEERIKKEELPDSFKKAEEEIPF